MTREERLAAYSTAIRTAMARQGVTSERLAAMVGVSPVAVSTYRCGRSLPLPEQAAAIAEALDTPSLNDLARVVVPCAICGSEFVVSNRGGYPQRYCGRRCQHRAGNKRQRARTRRRHSRPLSRATNDNRLLRRQIKKHCLECAGESKVCPMIPLCHFIPVTELPKRHRVLTVVA